MFHTPNYRVFFPIPLGGLENSFKIAPEFSLEEIALPYQGEGMQGIGLLNL